MASIRQVKAARALLGWSQGDLAERSGVSKPTVARLETGEGDLGGYADTRDKILSALEAAGVIFIEQNGEGPGVRLRKQAPGA
ncbi:helix-turn-helix transcriptional regulator [Methylobacterium sp. 10]|uniref:helix-turn-helix domain-containing protein n=1 Tax=Methylobacterium sp. 10 TaxID=1101191 RepID=UPI0004878184|nr:helix-turn-helix transcriptional regulator [Methylobacterium sp. 10]